MRNQAILNALGNMLAMARLQVHFQMLDTDYETPNSKILYVDSDVEVRLPESDPTRTKWTKND